MQLPHTPAENAEVVKVKFHRSPNENEYDVHSEATIPDPVNPFWADSKHRTCAQYLKMFFVGLVLFVPRLTVALIGFFMAYVVSTLMLCCRSREENEERPLHMRCGRFVISAGARMVLWGLGFWWITVKNDEAYGQPTEAPIIVMNHTNFVEVFYMVYAHNTMAVGKEGAVNAPLVGKIAQALQCIPVSRTDPQSRKKVTQEIRRRTRWSYDEAYADERKEFGDWNPLLIFPEGTCTNQRSLIQFKAGAFIPGVPVQPVVMKLPYRYFDLAFTTISGSALIVGMMCQVYNKMVIEYLPVYSPSEMEQRDPQQYANRVRSVMAAVMDVPMTNHTYEDVLLGYEIELMELPFEAFNVEMGRFQDLGLDKAKAELQRFAALDKDHDGRLNEEEFGEFFRLNEMPELRNELFKRWDRNKDGTINFREYLMMVGSQRVRRTRKNSAIGGGQSLVQLPKPSPKENDDEESVPPSAGEVDIEEQELMYAYTLCFGAFDTDHDNVISLSDFKIGMKHICPGLSEAAIAKLFMEIDTKRNGIVSLDEFLDYSTLHSVFMENLLQLIEDNPLTDSN